MLVITISDVVTLLMPQFTLYFMEYYYNVAMERKFELLLFIMYTTST